MSADTCSLVDRHSTINSTYGEPPPTKSARTGGRGHAAPAPAPGVLDTPDTAKARAGQTRAQTRGESRAHLASRKGWATSKGSYRTSGTSSAVRSKKARKSSCTCLTKRCAQRRKEGAMTSHGGRRFPSAL